MAGIKESNYTDNNGSDFNKQTEEIGKTLNIASEDSIIFQGVENPLNITDYGYLYENNQEISFTNETELNLTYPLDDAHNWKVSQINNTVKNIQDTRNWITNNDFRDITVFRVNITVESPHNYLPSQAWPASLQTITETGAIAMRVHFVNISFENNVDYISIMDEDLLIMWRETGFIEDFYSTWIYGEDLNVYYYSNGTVEEYGYLIDYYEFVNDSSNFYINNDTWGSSGNSAFAAYNTPGYVDNISAMNVILKAGYLFQSQQYYALYYADEFSEVYQNISIPRGEIVDAYISFDYFAESCMETNNNFLYIEINKQKIYSLGLLDVVAAGRKEWHNTGKIHIPVWVNTTEIFDETLNSQELNISIGIKSASSSYYGGYVDRFQQVFWFDNITLGVTALANSSQEGVNLTINNYTLLENEDWGSSSFNLIGNWQSNPVVLTVNTSSPSLDFEMNTTLSGYHNSTSKINQQNNEGINYKILENGTISCEFYHNLYMPAQYSDFEFIIDKPLNWQFISVLDPTLQVRPFEGGNQGDNYLRINKSVATFPGWWTFKAVSPNYLNLTNTNLYKNGQWAQTTFRSGDKTMLKTQVNYSNDIPIGVESFPVNLTIYNPDGDVWYEESKNPLANGTVIFSQIEFASTNTTGGVYNYTVFWSNGTALGGLNSSFELIHNSSLSLLKPDDAILDYITDAFIGDLIPIRINFKDSENNQSISNALILYNWTDGSRNITESAQGIYETVLYTSDLGSNGFYKIFIQSATPGFESSNFTLTINLGEKTILQVLDSDYSIETHANSSIRFKYYSELSGQGINFTEGCVISVNITNPSFYWIQNTGDGIYEFEFNTSYIDNLGIHKIKFNFTAPSFEPQYYTHQFSIIQQPVNFTAQFSFINLEENDIVEATFNDNLVISIRIMSIHDLEFLSGGNITFVSQNYVENLTENGNSWYNASILCTASRFSFGINSIYLKFEHINYSTSFFAFQLIVNQIDIELNSISYHGNVEGFVGESVKIQIELRDSNTNDIITGASVSFVWDYGVGSFTYNGDGIYELELDIPGNTEGNHEITLIISTEGPVYRIRESTLFLSVSVRELPSFFIWIIFAILLGASAILGIMSYRSYVIIPRRRRRKSELLAKTQRFKDIRNIQAIVFVHNLSGVPLYFKNYGHFEDRDKELFSGFIQAITTLGEEFARRDSEAYGYEKEPKLFGEDILELNFKYFHTLISDYQTLRIVLIVQDKCSERLKKQINLLAATISSQLADDIENFQGAIDIFDEKIPPILNNFLGLHFKERFKLATEDDTYFLKLNKICVMFPLEFKIIKTLETNTVDQKDFLLESILEWVPHEDENLIISIIESLMQKKIIVLSN